MKRLTPVVLLIALSISCSSGEEPGASLTEDTSTGGAATTGTTAASQAPSNGAAGAGGAAGVAVDFPTGPAVLVAQDYTPLRDRIDNTGAYLPANGKPTLVFVEAIW